ncbi:hypothetical protein K491DRAFT_197032 [Lophiostoma macrostomum CBS 122681]|uniref:Uncharacterized protein n=1 Tax=Lophiostoma macrostomum CBS 122681 TaxID=1314788 RepID=A0A6A6SNX6_9PLEO|nr:hypothetical protein K491DRAFT_197032 [Lophiostoma macrostomum CBS 122681]
MVHWVASFRFCIRWIKMFSISRRFKRYVRFAHGQKPVQRRLMSVMSELVSSRTFFDQAYLAEVRLTGPSPGMMGSMSLETPAFENYSTWFRDAWRLFLLSSTYGLGTVLNSKPRHLPNAWLDKNWKIHQELFRQKMREKAKKEAEKSQKEDDKAGDRAGDRAGDKDVDKKDESSEQKKTLAMRKREYQTKRKQKERKQRSHK